MLCCVVCIEARIVQGKDVLRRIIAIVVTLLYGSCCVTKQYALLHCYAAVCNGAEGDGEAAAASEFLWSETDGSGRSAGGGGDEKEDTNIQIQTQTHIQTQIK